MSTDVPPSSLPASERAATGVRRSVSPPHWSDWWRPPAEEGETLWGISARDRWVLTCLLVPMAMMVTLHGWRWAETERSTVTVVRAADSTAPAVVANTPVPAAAPALYVFQVDVNRATWIEWAQLDGIGETLAKRIVADRQENGPFQSVEDLRRVKGIGAKTLDKMRPHLTFASAESHTNE